MISTVLARVRQRWVDFWAALRVGPVWLGLAGTALLALGALSPAYLPQASPYWPTMRALGLDSWWARALATAMVIGAIGLLIIAWFRIRGAIYRDVKHWAVLVWWSLPLLVAPPIFSHDAYSYAAHGWLLHNGLNPYEASPSVLPGAFADQVAWLWRYTPSPYGPLSLTISHWLVELAGLNPYYSAVAQRIPALIGVGLLVHFLPRIAVQLRLDPRRTAWFATINPLMVIDLVGGAHNDALMLGLAALAIHLAYRGWFWPAVIAVGVGMSIKQPALLAAVPVAVIGSGWASWRAPDLLRFAPRALVTLLGVIGVFAGVTMLTGLGFGWISAMTVPGMIVTLAPFSLIGWGLQHLLELAGLLTAAAWAMPVAKAVSLAIMVALIGWMLVRFVRTRPLSFMTWAYLAFAILGPALHTWYLLWGALFLPLARTSDRTLRVAAGLTSVLLVYGAGNLAWRNDAVSLALAAVAAASGWLLSRTGRRRPSARPRDPASYVPVGSPYEAMLASEAARLEALRVADARPDGGASVGDGGTDPQAVPQAVPLATDGAETADFAVGGEAAAGGESDDEEGRP
ncbi:MAG: polyprenol phosphomannose-dependent alpha 1,6 mannosyltransferase MptB [Propioniciclava sp.]|uniref:polyprenol phosphomannose-dependent alpha 1,6 mannosyltransferase MptB n=1 Tax=Propioniciclava sp. TaxID=2038686 RepID=UPI0039E2D78E